MIRIFAFVVATTIAFVCTNAFGQDKKNAKQPPPSTETLKTKDGLKLRAFYFPSDKGKEAIPVLIVHEWGGQASPYAKLVVALRKAGCAVLVPDYRGHGGSKEYIDRTGQTKTFNTDTMSKADVGYIIQRDLEAAKKFLRKENDAGKLNLNALVVIGVREGCVIAAHWAQRDWQFAPVGALKRGQDVKALVFVSPKKVLKGVPIDATLRDPAILSLPMMIVAGSESPEASEAKRIGKRVEAVKKKMGRGAATGLETGLVRTSLSGASLVNESAPVIPAITKFILAQVEVSDEKNEWVSRGE